ncbi:DUF883 C-terminal domain-containing protein [Rhodohalobacter sp. 8-1]|uniref:DUF883 C-terminal domain-containing protein n=1 Tax=Rhodohalobacter sp. 8-1 TaxID=3131972 RepID=UPI0030EC3EFE
MSKKKNQNIDDIQLRKEKLQSEIELIEEKYSRKASKISGGIDTTLKPIKKIRDNPFKAIGISIAVGLIAGVSGRKKRKSAGRPTDVGSNSGSKGTGFTSLLISELKRMAAKRAMIYISDIVDRKVMPGLTSSKSDSSEENPSSDYKSDR